jgi:aryl-alcohol dehydrogenase-like predicted oxidoreductase
LATDCDPDVFLLAGRYTLLEQGGLGDLLPLARRKRFSFLLGGPYNSGILATGAVPGAKYNYKDGPARDHGPRAPDRGRVRRHGVPLKAARSSSRWACPSRLRRPGRGAPGGGRGQLPPHHHPIPRGCGAN